MVSRTRFALFVLLPVLAVSLVVFAVRAVAPAVNYFIQARKEMSKGQDRTLSSGKVIRVISQEIYLLPEKTLSFSYRTTLDVFRDQARLKNEVTEIWRDLESHAEQQGVSRVVIWPSHLEIGISQMREPSTAFEFMKSPSGRWVCRRCGG